MLKFIIKYVRPVVTAPIKFCFWLRYLFIYLTDENAKFVYRTRKAAWDNIKTYQEIKDYLKANYTYTWDGWKGILDHDNSDLEFFIGGGDCDDIAFMVAKKINSITDTKILFAKVCWVYGNGPKNWHFDCYTFSFVDGIKWFNYGQEFSDKKEYHEQYGWKNKSKFVEL